MRVSRILGAGAIATTLVLGLTGPAAAEDLHFVGTKKVVVNQSYENVSWRLAGDTTSVDDVDATLEHVNTREMSDFDYASSAPWSGTFRFYDFERLGRYKIYGSAWDLDFNELSVAPAYVTVKRAANMRLTASRKNGRVTLRTLARKYTGSYPSWAAHRGARIRYQRAVNGSWRTIAARTVPANGHNTLTLRAPRRAYRVMVVETAYVWGATSPTRTG